MSAVIDNLISKEEYNIYENRIEKLCEELHELMQNQTGGDWQKFILKINEKKEVETEFSYEPQTIID